MTYKQNEILKVITCFKYYNFLVEEYRFHDNNMNWHEGEVVKENVVPRAPLSTWWLAAALAGTALALAAAAHVDRALPRPLERADAPPDRFVAETAYEHLVNLTAIGPRVAGSYENEVVAVSTLVAAIRRVAADASPHNRVEMDVYTASGAFPITFLDGMNNVYRDVQSVVARVSGAGGRARSRSALLLNCHFDTVPDSPGASDDGAGCAVLLESMRALAAARRPLRHDAVFLFNGAEENIMQASHGFITQHPWAKWVRAFINIEACGAGGREVLFQAGPHDPWIVEVYAGAVPHPFASSLAQELFESGLIPADTDFRIFRDFGGLSGVDLAWSSNGYVYHTRLDTAERVPRAALQRTGDNVLALAQGLLASEALESEADASSRQPVFFDVLGAFVVSARAPAAGAAAALAAALVALKLRLSARDARRELFESRGAWGARLRRAALAGAAAQAAGAAAACAVALLLHAAGARLAFYSRATLLAPLYALPALAGSWAAALRLARGPRAGAARGWWGARAWHDAGCCAAALALAACALRGLRSGFLPLLWALLPAGADVAASLARAGGGARAAVWAAGAALPLLQTCYLALGSLHTLVPLAGRAGAGPVPPDVAMAALVALLVLTASGWMLPFVIAARNPRRLVLGAAALCAAACLLAGGSALGAPYSAERPQRLMLFHTRRTLHAPLAAPDAPQEDVFYWIPDLDVNTPHSVDAAGERRAPPAPAPAPPRELTARCSSRDGGGGGGERRGVRALAVLRRAVLPAGAEPGGRVAPPARAQRAARAPARPPARGAAQRDRARAADRVDRAEPRGGHRVAGGGLPRVVELGGGGAAGGPALGRAPHLLLPAARRARGGGGRGVAAGAARAARARRSAAALGGRVAGGARAVRRGRAAGRAPAPAGRAAGLGGRHGLGRGPAPVPRVAAPVPRVAAPVPRVAAPVPRVAAPVPRVAAPVPRVAAPVPRVAASVPR